MVTATTLILARPLKGNSRTMYCILNKPETVIPNRRDVRIHYTISGGFSEVLGKSETFFFAIKAQVKYPPDSYTNMKLTAPSHLCEITDNVCQTVEKTQNWKAPRVGGIHKFWWEKLTSIFSHLPKFFNKTFDNPKLFPEFFTQGILASL